MLGLLSMCGCLLVASPSTLIPANCGVEAVAALSRAVGRTVAPAEVQGLAAAWPGEEVSLLDVQHMADRVRLPLAGVRATVAELLADHTPCIVHLGLPAHFAVLLDGDAEHLRLLTSQGGTVSLVSRPEIEARFTGAALILPEPPPGPAPRVRFERTWHAFGVTGTGQTVTAEFRFRNEGRQDLFVDPQGRSCSCTTTLESRQTVPPGGSGAITVNQRVDRLGTIDEHIAVATSDPWKPVVFLSLHGRGLQGLRVVPDRLVLWTERWKPRARTFQLIGPPGLLVTTLVMDFDLCDARLVERVEDDQRVRYTIEYFTNVEAPPGRHETHLVIETNHADQPKIEIPLTVEVKPELTVEPARVFLYDAPVGIPTLTRVRLRCAAGWRFQVPEVTSDQGFVSLRALARLPDGGFEIRLVVKPPGPGYHRAEVKVRVDREGEEDLRVPVSVYVAD